MFLFNDKVKLQKKEKVVGDGTENGKVDAPGVTKGEARRKKVSGMFKIHKADEDKHLAFGWAHVAIREDGEQIQDLQGDVIDPEVLENAAYRFVLMYREGGEMHERGDCAVLVESVMFTKEKMLAMGIPEGTVPEGWWIGFFVTDEEVWQKVKSGEYPMFSIEGEAAKTEIPDQTETE